MGDLTTGNIHILEPIIHSTQIMLKNNLGQNQTYTDLKQ